LAIISQASPQSISCIDFAAFISEVILAFIGCAPRGPCRDAVAYRADVGLAAWPLGARGRSALGRAAGRRKGTYWQAEAVCNNWGFAPSCYPLVTQISAFINRNGLFQHFFKPSAVIGHH
jgi:hypothetical protein